MAGGRRAEPGRLKGKSGKARKTHHYFFDFFKKIFFPARADRRQPGLGKFLQKMASSVVRFPGYPTLTPAKTLQRWLPPVLTATR
jgi:hypothetical protein